MVKSILSSPQENVLTNALSAAALRHKVISNNIANVNTPGFKRSVVSFEDHLAEAIEQGGQVLTLTHDRHLPGRMAGGYAPVISTDANTSLRTDGNNVDIDVEMANLAKNNIYYDAVVGQLSRYFSNLKSAINEGRR